MYNGTELVFDLVQLLLELCSAPFAKIALVVVSELLLERTLKSFAAAFRSRVGLCVIAV
jgi:hypothetical protein